MNPKHLTIKAVIVDDENNARERLSRMLKRFETIELLQSYELPEEALRAIIDLKPALVFVDVEMPQMSGFELVKKIKAFGFDPYFVFVTAFNQYAIKAIKADAFDFLLKPIDLDELNDTIERVSQSILNSGNSFHTNISSIKTSDRQFQKVRFNSNSGFLLIDPNDILFCQADGPYTIIHLKNGKEITESKYLSEVETKLQAKGFIRISRFHLVNIDAISSVDKRKRHITLVETDQTTILKISKRFIPVLDHYFL